MMKTSIAKVVFAALTVVLAGGAPVLAQGPGMGPGPEMGQRPGMGDGFAQHRPPFERAMGDQGRWWDNPRMAAQLKLTDDQRKAMDGIWFDHREKLIDLEANLQRAELAMEPLMSADQPDQAAMEAQIDKIVDARAGLERANARFLLDIRMKLTPDQWKQLKTMREHMRDMRGPRMDGMHKGGPGQKQMWRHGPGGPGGPGGPPPGAQPGNPPVGNPPPPAETPQGSSSGEEQ